MITNPSDIVLLIEDDEVDRESVHRAIGATYQLIDAEHGKQGLAIAVRERPACVLLDFRLPDLDGLDIVPELVANDIPVIMMTSAGSEATAVEAMKAGATDYITKDGLSPSTISTSIARAIVNAEVQRKLAEQREELENFVAAASHDLRAPLRHIVNYAEFAKEDLQVNEYGDLGSHHEQIISAGARMSDLLESLVRFARSGRSQTALEPVSLDSVVSQTLQNLSFATEEAGAIVNSQALPIVCGHEPSLIELMQNLIGNAIKYRGESDPIINVSATVNKTETTIHVRDNGIGIAEQYLESVFAPFHRLHSYQAIKGSGIGLANCKRIVKHHGGEIWSHSQPGNGATFSFTLQTDTKSSRNSADTAFADSIPSQNAIA